MPDKNTSPDNSIFDNTNADGTALSNSSFFPIVAIGASAGGLEAISLLLQNLPVSLGMAYVVVQHLSPDYNSILPELLERKTQMPVHQVTNRMQIQPDHIYVIPPNTYMSITDGHLTLSERDKGDGNHSIDFFLTALAPIYQNKAIAVILSGSGNDGMAGVEIIKAEGGITIAQDDTALFQSMPHNAKDSGFIDFILSPARIAQELQAIAQTTFANDIKINIKENETELKRIHTLLLNKRGVDFTLYKQTTITRRIMRRMALNRLSKLEQYTRMLMESNGEADLLYKDLLINVTSFFRDAKMYQELFKKIFPALIKNQKHGEALRIWVPACSSGEEAYSIAICLFEYLKDKALSTPVQIFATDLSETAIDKARIGIYPKATLQNLSPQRLKKYFVKIDGHSQIIKPIRDICVFATHNLLKDPPFSRMDLISCQNVLIYLEGNAQKKIMHSFHYALKPSGFLVLGKSETVGNSTELFNQEDKDLRIYTRKSALPAINYNFSFQNYNYLPENTSKGLKNYSQQPSQEIDTEREAEKLLLNNYTPAGVLVNKDMHILRFYGITFPYMQPSSGKASLHLLKMVRDDLVFELRSLLTNAKKGGTMVRREGVHFVNNVKSQRISLEITPVRSPTNEQCYLILFLPDVPFLEDKLEKVPALRLRKDEKDKRIDTLERELRDAREQMKTMSEEFEATREELQSANEEILSSNEELQSINEELETSKEELQSTNEELTTINEELQLRNTELKESVDFTEAIVQTIREPLIVLHADMRVRTANKAFLEVFKLTQEEVEGYFLYEIGNGLLEIAELRQQVTKILAKGLSFNDFEVKHNFKGLGDRTLLFNAMRMNGDSGKRSKLLLVIEDITVSRNAITSLKNSEERLKAVINQATAGIAIRDLDGNITFCNKKYADIAGYTEAEMLGMNMKQFVYPNDLMEDQKHLNRLKNEGLAFEIEKRYVKKDGEIIWTSNSISAILGEEGKPVSIINVTIDVTSRKAAEETLHTREAFISAVNNTVRVGIVLYTMIENKIIYANNYIHHIIGYSREELSQLTGTTIVESVHIDDREEYILYINQCRHSKSGETMIHEYRLQNKRGDYCWLQASGAAFERNEKGVATELLFALQDITIRKTAEEELRQSEERYRISLEAGELAAWDWNMETDVVVWNEQHYTLFGVQADNHEVKVNEFVSFIYPEDQQKIEYLLKHAAEVSGLFKAEFRIIRKDDKMLRWMSGYGRVTEEKNGKATRMTGVMYDITESKNAEEKLMDAQASLNIALEAAQMGVWDINVETGEIVHSTRHDQLFGYDEPQVEWDTEKAQRYIVESDKAKYLEGINAMYETGKVQLELQILHTNGTICWINIFGHVYYNEDKKPLQAAGVIFDITDRKSIEKQKDDFIGIASHELKTPVTSIKAYSEILQDIFQEKNDQKSAMLAAKLNVQVDRLTSLIRDLLDVTRITEGQLTLTREVFNINLLLDEVVEEMQLTTQKHAIIKEVPLLPDIIGDKERIAQVLINFLSNAIKYSPDSKRIKVSGSFDEENIYISIRDYGIGMSPETQRKVFDRFFRSAETGMGTFPGLGLGLFIAGEIVKRHQGAITVTSTPGKGSTFTFQLPLHIAAEIS